MEPDAHLLQAKTLKREADKLVCTYIVLYVHILYLATYVNMHIVLLTTIGLINYNYTFNFNQTDKEAKSRTYVEAIIRFISCGKALEVRCT